MLKSVPAASKHSKDAITRLSLWGLPLNDS
jgi:hypothetical protein